MVAGIGVAIAGQSTDGPTLSEAQEEGAPASSMALELLLVGVPEVVDCVDQGTWLVFRCAAGGE